MKKSETEVERQQQQMLEGHSGAFGNVVMQDGQDKAAILAFWERNHASPEANKLRILDLKPGGAKVRPQNHSHCAAPTSRPTSAKSGFSVLRSQINP